MVGVLSLVYGVTVVSCHHGRVLATWPPSGTRCAAAPPTNQSPAAGPSTNEGPGGMLRRGQIVMVLTPMSVKQEAAGPLAGPTNNIWHEMIQSGPWSASASLYHPHLYAKILNIIQPWSSEPPCSYISEYCGITNTAPIKYFHWTHFNSSYLTGLPVLVANTLYCQQGFHKSNKTIFILLFLECVVFDYFRIYCCLVRVLTKHKYQSKLQQTQLKEI